MTLWGAAGASGSAGGRVAAEDSGSASNPPARESHQESKPAIDVCLVQMPIAQLNRPSLALGLLKASLRVSSLRCEVLYPDFAFAEAIGLDVYLAIAAATGPPYLLGEWTFAAAAFPDFQPDCDAYLETVATQVAVGTAERGDERRWKEVLRDARAQASIFVDAVAARILERGPKIVGCSSTFDQHCASLALLRRIRAVAPEVITMMGGANCEAEMGEAVQHAFPWVDFVVSGEADLLFPELCQLVLEHGRDLDPGRLPQGVMPSRPRLSRPRGVPEPPRAVVADLDRLPIPDFDDYFAALRQSPIGRFIRPALPIQTARGCWWGEKHHCAFCGLNGVGIRYRACSPERAVTQFLTLGDRYETRRFMVLDNIIDPAHIRSVLPRLTASGRTHHLFYETPANLKREQLKAMADAGVHRIQPGIESMSDAVLESFGKSNRAWMNIQLLRWCRELGIDVAWHFLSRFPGERDEWYAGMASWLPLLVHLQPPGGIFRIRYSRFSPYYDLAEQHGIALVPYHAYSLIYPVDAPTLANLAYYFEDANERGLQPSPPHYLGEGGETGGEDSSSALESSRLGLASVRAIVREWRDLWKRPAGERPELAMRVVGDGVEIVDTRPGARVREVTLTGAAAAILVACDSARSRRALPTLAPLSANPRVDASEIPGAIAELAAMGLLLEQGGRLLSLAVRYPYRHAEDWQNPSGFIGLKTYLRQRQLRGSE
ncbi:MAG: RiPP maturation radical SAM protein 1 [Candidatus Schekmanbacteria bacterium]|nr:RiPP maturation radical SAM protein 1 [Candidatus Schekmanbacteria bacterium]